MIILSILLNITVYVLVVYVGCKGLCLLFWVDSILSKKVKSMRDNIRKNNETTKEDIKKYYK